MSRLTIERGQAIVEQNIKRLYRIPQRYVAINYYLERYNSTLKRTLLAVFNYMKDKQIVIDKHRYEFIISTLNLTAAVRKKTVTSTTNRHMNMLCALGLLGKVYQSKDRDILLELNKQFLADQPDKRPINVYSFREYTDYNLDVIENRAERLKVAGITTGNISFVQLVENDLRDIADEVYYANNRKAPEKKEREAAELFNVMEMLTDAEGYCTRLMVYDNLSALLPEKEIDKLFRIYRLRILEIYKFAPPTNEQKEKWGLLNWKYIYVRKNEES